MNTTDNKKILTLADAHNPYNIDLSPILEFAHDFKPDVVQYLGDMTNAESCNHWKREKGYRPDVATVAEDYSNLEHDILLPFKRACPKASTVYHIGNHEDWFYQAMLRYDFLHGFLSFEKNISLEKYNMELIPLNGFKSFGHLYFTHGCYAGGDHHAKKMVTHYRKNVRYGHIHDIQDYSIQSPLDAREKMYARCIGCLCDDNAMEYLKKKPDKWVNAFHIAYIREDGTFNDYTIVITDGRFTAPDGRVYGSKEIFSGYYG